MGLIDNFLINIRRLAANRKLTDKARAALGAALDFVPGLQGAEHVGKSLDDLIKHITDIEELFKPRSRPIPKGPSKPIPKRPSEPIDIPSTVLADPPSTVLAGPRSTPITKSLQEDVVRKAPISLEKPVKPIVKNVKEEVAKKGFISLEKPNIDGIRKSRGSQYSNYDAIQHPEAGFPGGALQPFLDAGETFYQNFMRMQKNVLSGFPGAPAFSFLEAGSVVEKKYFSGLLRPLAKTKSFDTVELMAKQKIPNLTDLHNNSTGNAVTRRPGGYCRVETQNKSRAMRYTK